MAAEGLPLLVAAIGAAVWTVDLAWISLGNGVLALVTFTLPLAFFSNGVGWIAVRRIGVGLTVFFLRGSAVLIMLYVGLIAAFASGYAGAFFFFLALCLASSVVSVVTLAISEARAPRTDPSPIVASGDATEPPDSSRPIVPRRAGDRRRAALILLATMTSLGALVFAVAIGVGYSRGSRSDGRALDSDLSLTQAKVFRPFPLYWVGPEYDGQPLDRIIGPYAQADDYMSTHSPVLFIYGQCGRTFESGCVPPLVVKTMPNCIIDPAPTRKIRERVVGSGDPLEVQAGNVKLTIFAAKDQQERVVQQLVGMNPNSFPELTGVRPGSPLPGSLCELALVHPRVFPTAAPATPATSGEAKAATVITSFGAFETVKTFAQAEQKLGWRPLRSSGDARFTLADALSIGAIRTFKNPLPRLEQVRYDMVDHGYAIEVTQEPESYLESPIVSATTITATYGQWTGKLWQSHNQIDFTFFSGATVAGERIRVSAAAEGYTPDELGAFVQSLRFD